MSPPTGLHSGGLCPRASCEDRCGKSSTDDDSLCSCDPRCQTLGDCCVDFSTVCSSLAKLFPAKQYKGHSFNLALIENNNATAPESKTHLLVAFRLIDNCPQTSSLQEKCKNAGSKNDLGQQIPVCHPRNQVVYQNQYCAYCSGYRMHDLVSFEFHVDITSPCKEPSTQVPGSNKPEMSLERIFRECTTRPYVFIPKKCYSAVYRNKLYHRRDNSMCKSHLNPVIVINSSRVYQNKHCLSEGTTHIECFNGEWPSSLPTTVPRGVDEIISLDSTGVPFLHQKVTSASNAPIQCVSLNILVIYIYIYIWLSG